MIVPGHDLLLGFRVQHPRRTPAEKGGMKFVVRSSAAQMKAPILAAAFILIPCGSFANEFTGWNLTIPVDTRAEAMGRAWAPLSTTAIGAWSNVGGLAMSP